MLAPRDSRTTRRLPHVFLALMIVPSLALVWLTSGVLERDRRLDAQRTQEQVERVADRVVAASHQRLAELDAFLQQREADERVPLPSGVVWATAEAGHLRVQPNGALVFLPRTREPEESPIVFRPGETAEIRQGNLAQAARSFAALTRDSDAAVRAGAWLRLARVERRAGRYQAARAAYIELAALGATDVSGYPAALLAHAGQCALLSGEDHTTERLASGRAMLGGLTSGAWPPTPEAYAFYIDEARRCADATETEHDRRAQAVAAAFRTLHDDWIARGTVPARQGRIVAGRPVLLAATVRTGRMAVVLAGTEFLEASWSDVADATVFLTDPSDGTAILGAAPATPQPQAVRPTDTSRLPWTVRVTPRISANGGTPTNTRSLMIWSGLGVVLLVIGASAYVAGRGMSRELSAARFQSDFVAAVSHEFRTPLASVRHLSDLLARGRVITDEQRQQCYELLARESQRLQRLVEDLLDFGRLDDGTYEYRFARVNVADLLQEVVREASDPARARTHRIDLAIENEVADVLADRDALGRAIRNVIDNAIKYSPGANVVHLTLSTDARTATIRVRDEGLGIAPEEQAEIFGRFVRGSNARAGQISGTGIGLAMARHVVHAHQGEILVESELQKGSTFTITVPLADASAPPPHDMPAAQDPAHATSAAR